MTNQRNTVQRQIVLDAVNKAKQHPTVDDVYGEVKKNYPTVSKATVYRNLRQLAAGGILRRILLSDGLERYDQIALPHYHFDCKCCGKIFDLEIPYLNALDQSLTEQGFSTDTHDIVFSGICVNCRLDK